jgi:hypothetical protein
MTDDVEKGAVLSDDGVYRYRLWRRWSPSKAMAFVMLNPSTADAERDDPTIRRCMGFARREGYGGIEVINLYAMRSTSPTALLEAIRYGQEIEGIENIRHWTQVLMDRRVGPAVVAWGASGPFLGHKRFPSMAWDHWKQQSRWWALGTTKSGEPRHPLYLPNDAPLVPWRETCD